MSLMKKCREKIGIFLNDPDNTTIYVQHDADMLLLTIFPLSVRGIKDPTISTFSILLMIFPCKLRILNLFMRC